MKGCFLLALMSLAVFANAQTVLRSRPTVDVSLIANPVVQKDLAVTEEQGSKLAQLMKRIKEERVEISGGSQEEIEAQLKEYSVRFDKVVWDGLAKSLDEKQLNRFKQINRQAQGIRALAGKEAKDALKLTVDQDKRILTILEAFDSEEGEMMASAAQAGDGSGQIHLGAEDAKKLKALAKQFYDKAVEALTPEQKTLWEEMLGPKLDLGA